MHDESVDLGLEASDGLHLALLRQELLQRLVEALDLSAGLGMVGARVLVDDAQAIELGLEQGLAEA